MAGAVALLAWGVLALGWTLHAAPGGAGTHTQLGLAACGTKALTGYPCPTCGMTTAFAAFVHGDLPAALRAQVLGAVLAGGTLLAALGGALMAATGVHLGAVLRPIFVQRIGWLYLLAALALGSWALKAATGW